MVNIMKSCRKFLGIPTLYDILGDAICAKRLERGISYEELAKKAEVTVEDIQKIENGKSVEKDIYFKIINTLGSSLEEIGKELYLIKEKSRN